LAHGFSFKTVLKTADDQIRYDALRLTNRGRTVVTLSFDSDFSVFGLKTMRLDPEKANGKNGIVGYVDLCSIKITPEINANQTLLNLIKISKKRTKGAILYSLID
jgi:hypothetical protein